MGESTKGEIVTAPQDYWADQRYEAEAFHQHSNWHDRETPSRDCWYCEADIWPGEFWESPR